MRKIIIFSLLLLFLIFTGCETQSENPLRIALTTWPGYEALVFAESEGLFEGVKVITLRVDNSTKGIEAFKENVVDLTAMTLDEAILLQSRMEDSIHAIAVLDVSHGGDAIIANASIKSIVDLKGKRVGVESTALGAFFLSRAVDSTPEITINQIQVVPLHINHHYEAFIKGEVDAVVTFEPVKSKILKLQGHSIYNSSMIPGEIVDVLIARKSLTAKRGDQVRALVDGYFRSIEYISKHPARALPILAGFENISSVEFKQSLEGLHIPDKKENHELLGGTSPKLIKTIILLQNFLMQKKIVLKAIIPKALVTDQLISE